MFALLSPSIPFLTISYDHDACQETSATEAIGHSRPILLTSLPLSSSTSSVIRNGSLVLLFFGCVFHPPYRAPVSFGFVSVMRSLSATAASIFCAVALVGFLQLPLAGPAAASQKIERFGERPNDGRRMNWPVEPPPPRDCEGRRRRRAREAREKREAQTGKLEFDYDACIAKNYVRLISFHQIPLSSTPPPCDEFWPAPLPPPLHFSAVRVAPTAFSMSFIRPPLLQHPSLCRPIPAWPNYSPAQW